MSSFARDMIHFVRLWDAGRITGVQLVKRIAGTILFYHACLEGDL